jgi:hypothetical protein
VQLFREQHQSVRLLLYLSMVRARRRQPQHSVCPEVDEITLLAFSDNNGFSSTK